MAYFTDAEIAEANSFTDDKSSFSFDWNWSDTFNALNVYDKLANSKTPPVENKSALDSKIEANNTPDAPKIAGIDKNVVMIGGGLALGTILLLAVLK